jgi:predicted transcriptional regulator
MRDWKELLVSPLTSIIETMKNIDQTAAQIALVVDDDFRLLGTVTDGDIRRGILKGISLDQEVTKVMNHRPISMRVGASKQEIKKLFQQKNCGNFHF